MIKERNYRFDNFKLVLIILVIFAHLLELFKGKYESVSKLYLIIYTFYMPLFIFISGLFAKFDKRKIFSLIFTYAIFQVLYRSFDLKLFNPEGNLICNYTTPYWLLWYLFVMILYLLLIPLIDSKKIINQIIVLVISIFLSLVASKDNSVGYYVSLSRFFTFLPWFVFGFYFRNYLEKFEELIKNKKVKFTLLSIAFLGTILISIFIVNNNITQNMLYGSYSYESAKYSISLKALFMIFGLFWLLLFYLIIPNKKFDYVTVLGSNTITIFLFHGFLVKYLQKIQYFTFEINENITKAFLITLIVTVVFGNKYVSKFLKFIFCGEFLIVLYNMLFNRENKQALI